MKSDKLFLVIALAASCSHLPEVEVDSLGKGAQIPESLYGVFFEEITGSGDGGLYAEMVRGRGFEEGVIPSGCTLDAAGYAAAPLAPCYSNDSINAFKIPWAEDKDLEAWKVSGAGKWQITDKHPLNGATSHSLELQLEKGAITVENEGYWGMSIKGGECYDLSFYLRSAGVEECSASLIDAEGLELDSHRFETTGDGRWHQYSATFHPSESKDGCSLRLSFPQGGTAWLDFVSLFPESTYKGRSGGLRKDLAELIEDLHPAFVRWPGGCIVEGLTLANRVKWKETLGPVENRPGEYDLWGYRATYGLGYHEFLLFCEDIGSKAMFVCNAGMSCLFRNGDFVMGADLEPFIQDALDAIEYAIGDTDTEWGAKRAAVGHPEPFPLEYVEVGNENVFGRYVQNYNRFYSAIKERYPAIKVVSALMFSKDLEDISGADLIDPHYYEASPWFYDNADVFDKLPDDFPYKVYVGEYAAVDKRCMESALAEAAFLTGVERNSDKVQLVSYAPLMENAHFGRDHMIVFDSGTSYGRSNYQVLKLFAHNKPDYVLPLRINDPEQKVPFTPVGEVSVRENNACVEFNSLDVKNHGDTCTICFKALKKSGLQGWQVVFGQSGEGHCFMADYGSHSNESVLFREVSERGDVSLFDYRNQCPITTGVWHDVKVELAANHWTAWLDGDKVVDYHYLKVKRHYAVAGFKEDSGEIILKIVNGESTPWKFVLNLNTGASKGEIITLAAENGNDENSFEAPEKIAPKAYPFRYKGRKQTMECPANSLTIIKLNTKS